MGDVVGQLWAASLACSPALRCRLIDACVVPHIDGLKGHVLQAVSRHLRALAETDAGLVVAGRSNAEEAVNAWIALERAIATTNPELVPLAHAFHARLASRHQSAYGALARKQRLDLARCARLKTEALHAAALKAAGEGLAAAEALERISNQWRAGLPTRLPGLRAIELTGARWFSGEGREAFAAALLSRAETIAGVHAAYPEDAPVHWPPNPNQDELLRFAFAAARLPAAITAGESGEEKGTEP
ncbi:hypothetical protein FRZ61_51740 [Hypericibacter adhaerens]|uniref:Uncharacterized protein n=1 Tax=Hypericibacter adhaerens TaxID=2602016 RepID=A0A5J6N6M7_9PROT|nr:hypothetical protein [Hypericibacter adhaerens]QEX25227.1 hypothetical protein FRZ61_51740 [Hypericibacter adhaerens]